MQDVQKAAAIRLRVGDEQLARLFSGEPTVLKKAVSAEAGQPYLAELERMGMKARLESLAPLNDSQAVQVSFKVVFWGKTIKGYNKAQVMRAVPRRLRVDEAQVVRLFSGGKAVLKRGVSAEVGGRYVTELARIGMQVELEIETESLPVGNSTSSQIFAFNSAAGGVVSAPLVDEDSYGSFLQTQVDLQRNGTLLGTNIMGVLGAQEEPEVSTPPPVAPPAVVTPAEAKAQSVERLASAIELAYAEELGKHEDKPAARTGKEKRCPQCGHRQSRADRERCEACGCELVAKATKKKARKPEDEMTRSLHDELTGNFGSSDLATMMREMRQQKPEGQTATERRINPVPVLIGGACVLAVGGWLLLSR
ncbi:hypothetical protein VVD49_00755 [Uliginosibacterium sp. H3]|uniref:Zinc ribbon domain-containing protein n=1 Tax=Uliginosibacterium silvisoli TaxID=3114758 RepID=A0ABU6JXX3_9RHOO|nr:hypothetical protein [Uliginosibacterium sp. H3]